jgi:hypothetical protein
MLRISLFMGLVLWRSPRWRLRRTRTRGTGSSLVPRRPSRWETKAAGRVRTGASGATGGVTGGGVSAFRISDLAPAFLAFLELTRFGGHLST